MKKIAIFILRNGMQRWFYVTLPRSIIFSTPKYCKIRELVFSNIFFFTIFIQVNCNLNLNDYVYLSHRDKISLVLCLSRSRVFHGTMLSFIQARLIAYQRRLFSKLMELCLFFFPIQVRFFDDTSANTTLYSQPHTYEYWTIKEEEKKKRRKFWKM